MYKFKVVTNPGDEMVFERPLDSLMKEIQA